MPSLLHRSGEAPSRSAAATAVRSATQTSFRSLRERFAQGEIEWSPDLQRVVDLPRRKKPEGAEMQALIDAMTAVLKKPTGTQTLREVQAWALWEAPQLGGLLAPLATGAGKTLIGMLMPMVWPWVKKADGTWRPIRAVLLIPADLREQFAHDWEEYGKHWELPNLAGGRTFDKNKPVLHVVAYSELSHEKSSALLEQIDPDLVMGDEISSLKNFEASRTLRMRRLFGDHPEKQFCGWDATLISTSLENFWHLLLWALDVNAPVPLEESEMKKWASALDPQSYGDSYFMPGELEKRLCEPGETPRSGFQRRLVSSKGIVFTADNELGIPLHFIKRQPPPMPDNVKHYLTQLRRKPENGGWTRPDGELLRDMTEVTAVAKQLALGFFMYWRYLTGTDEQIEEWFLRRQAWNREVRGQVSRGARHLDSPKLVELAAERWYDGGCPGCPRGAMEHHAFECTRKEDHPIWESYSYPHWRRVEPTVDYVTETEWVSDWLLQDCAAWMAEKPGIVWVDHPEFGEKLSKLTKCPFYDGGKENNRAIINEDGKRSIICSVRANERGKNLQVFHSNLITTFPSSNKTVEQVIGRSYREGQRAPRVEVYYYLHTSELENSLSTALTIAKGVQELTGQAQKMVFGEWEKAA